MKKPQLTIHQWNRGSNQFTVDKSVNTTTHLPGSILFRTDVDSLIREGWTIIIVPKK